MGKGYDAHFLGSTVVPGGLPLPSLSETLENDVLERDTLSTTYGPSGGGEEEDGRRIYRNYHNYTIVMSKQHRTAYFAALNVDQSLLVKKTDKTVGWRIDAQVGAEHQLNGDYYNSNVWDKGHLAPDAAAGWGVTEDERIAATNDTYYYTNATLQHENFNRDEWKDLETIVRSWTTTNSNNRLNEITGPIFKRRKEEDPAATSSTAVEGTIQPDGRPVATIPAGFFKVVACVGGGSSQLEVKCFVMYQDAKSLQDRNGVVDHERYQVSISEIEQLTGLVFDPVYHQANNNNNAGNNNDNDDGVVVAPPAPSPSPPEPNHMDNHDDHGDYDSEERPIPAGVVLAAAMVDPVGTDSGQEWISILNNRTDNKTVSLQGWKISHQKQRHLVLEQELLLEPGVTTTIHPISPLRLVNSGGSLTLFNEAGDRIDHVVYTKAQVKEGVAVNLLLNRKKLDR